MFSSTGSEQAANSVAEIFIYMLAIFNRQLIFINRFYFSVGSGIKDSAQSVFFFILRHFQRVLLSM